MACSAILDIDFALSSAVGGSMPSWMRNCAITSKRETEKYVRSGMQADEARRKALIALGGVEQTRQRTREVRGTQLIDHMLQDLRYGARSLARNRGFTAVVILTLALGIGSCTAIFSLMVAVMFPPVPFGHAGRLVYVTTPNRNLAQVPPEAFVPNHADFADLKRETRSFSATGATIDFLL